MIEWIHTGPRLLKRKKFNKPIKWRCGHKLPKSSCEGLLGAIVNLFFWILYASPWFILIFNILLLMLNGNAMYEHIRDARLARWRQIYGVIHRKSPTYPSNDSSCSIQKSYMIKIGLYASFIHHFRASFLLFKLLRVIKCEVTMTSSWTPPWPTILYTWAYG